MDHISGQKEMLDMWRERCAPGHGRDIVVVVGEMHKSTVR